jgi:hypothetical protein
MWKLIAAFIIFAAGAMWLLSTSSTDVDMGGEKHEVSSHTQQEQKEVPKKQ